MAKKRSKPASKAQKRARERNWNKGHIISIRANICRIKRAETTPISERLALGDMIYKIDKILANWNKS